MPLTAADIGTRVVVRRRLAGQVGPSGGPALADVLGVLEGFDDAEVAVRREDGTLVRFRRDELVTGKPVPPRVATLLRVSADRLESIADAGWPATTVENVGAWRLRAAGGFTGRANSALPAGDPGLPVGAALDRVREFYDRRGLPPLLQVVVGSGLERELPAAGWQIARHEEGVLVQVASVAQARRAARRLRPGGAVGPVLLSGTLTAGWIGLYGRTGAVPREVLEHVLAGPEQVCLASIEDPPAAIGRAVVTGDWLGLSAVEVTADRRREGLARRVVDALLAWGAEHGATSAYLQTLPANAAALALYERYGFVTHHRYRYWRPVDTSAADSVPGAAGSVPFSLTGQGISAP